MKMFSKKILNQAVTIALIGMLSGCGCNRTPEVEIDEEVLVQEPEEINIVDPLITDKFDTHTIKTEPDKRETSKVQEEETKKKISEATDEVETEHKSIPYETYDESSYEDLDFVNYDSGLKYQILREGPSDAEMPKRGQTVSTHYICWHDNNGKPGNLVDNSYERGEPFEFKIGYGYVIRGWDEGIMDMRIGDKRRIYVPSEMAFGQAGAREVVPGDTDLIYEVELIDLK